MNTSILRRPVPLTARLSRAFGLLEVVLVFALVIGATAATFSVFQSAEPSAGAANEASKISVITGNLRSTYGLSHDYAALDTTTAIKARIIPASMVQTDGSVSTAWGPLQVVGFYADRRKFDVNLNDVPDAACAKFIADLAGSFDDVLVAGSGPDDMGGSVFTDGKLDMTKLEYWCSGEHTSDATVGIDFIGH